MRPTHSNRPSIKREDVKARNTFIAEAYAKSMPLDAICKATGLKRSSLKVIACRLGVTHKGQAWIDFRRGFSVPVDKAEDYRLLMGSYHYSSREAAKVLKLPMIGGAA